MKRWGALRLALWGVVLGLPALLAWRCVHQPPDDPNPRITGATLVEEPFSVRFEPGKGPGVPMRLDWADVKTFAHNDYFKRYGYSGMPSDTPIATGSLGTSGFAHLELAWPSTHMPDAQLCVSSAGAPQDSCPVPVTYLTSEPPRKVAARLVPGEIWQWTAFYTRRAGDARQWAGWQCDAQRLQAMNRDIGAPDADRRQWALHPSLLQERCGSPSGFLEKRLPTVSGLREHPVVWSCAPAADGNTRSDAGECTASFEHGGRLAKLRVPGRAWSGDAVHQMPPLLQMRPLLLEAAWRTLEDAAAAARQGAPGPVWHGSLKKEMGRCVQ
jgi:hypothetical protein